MVDFRPFKGISYDTKISGPLGNLICPPYDIISESSEQDLLERNSFNMVRLELAGTPEPLSQQRYLDAAIAFRSWLHQGVLIKDDVPSYYLLAQQFNYDQKLLTRYSLFGVLHLEDFGTNILPHEATKPKAKADRLALIEACAANFSPILGLHNDPHSHVSSICKRVSGTSPSKCFIDENGHTQRLWQISDLSDIGVIQEALGSTQVYIADGHHRYETALAYSKLHTPASSSADFASQFVMACLTSFDDAGLLILPYHRIVKSMDSQTLGEFSNRLLQVFHHASLPADKRSPDLLDSVLEQSDPTGPTFGLISSKDRLPFLLRLSDHPEVKKCLSSQGAPLLRNVDPWVLDRLLFKPVFGEKTAEYVEAVSSSKDAYKMAQTGESQFSFILRGVPPKTFKQVLDAGLLLPAKSTYFHPKLPSGILIHSLEGTNAEVANGES